MVVSLMFLGRNTPQKKHDGCSNAVDFWKPFEQLPGFPKYDNNPLVVLKICHAHPKNKRIALICIHLHIYIYIYIYTCCCIYNM